jgi:hypothetical protein
MRARRNVVREARAAFLFAGMSASDHRMIERLGREAETLAAAEARSVAGAALLRGWRPLHRVCAIAMLLAVALHTGVALYYGYGISF